MDGERRPENFLLASIVSYKISDEEALKDLRETKALIEAYGGTVIDAVIQRREVHDKGMYLGRGKISEIAELVVSKKIDVVVLNDIVKPGHIFEIKNLLYPSNRQIQVWDRADLILEIFSQHANTSEAKLQIELAAMRHMGPRIYGMGHVLSRQGGGIGTLGVGETNTELMKRHWQNQIMKVEKKLAKLAIDRRGQLARREKIGFKTVSLIGYTNAGKTSLFNLLTGKKHIANDALFVTLDSSVGKLTMPSSKQKVLVSDTIGFIRNLPAKLIDAFESTLMESVHADILLHVIDAADPDMERKIAAVQDVLRDLNLHHKRQIFIFNKTDLMNGQNKVQMLEKYADFSPVFISVKEKMGVEEILEQIEIRLGEPVVNVFPDQKRKRRRRVQVV